MPAVGEKFGRYDIEALLGAGGMGQVFRATDNMLHRKVALKVVFQQDEEGRARLLREARAAAALEHPNIVRVYDVGEHEGTLFIAMELLDGEPLRDRLAKQPTQAEVLGWMTDIARALGAAHERGLVHRDVKPDNVIIRGDGRATVLDFGIARRVEGQNKDELGTLTGKGILVGTPMYMSPEQLRNETLDGRTDQFAWGVMTYECLTGQIPWGATDVGMTLVSNILSKDMPPLPADVPPHVARTIARTLEKDPAKRFGSMQDVERSLSPEKNVSISPHVPAPVSDAFAVTEAAPTTMKRRDRRLRSSVLAGLAVSAVAIFLVTKHFSKAPPQTTAPVATTIMSLPLPTSSNPNALAAYKSGVQNIHDAQYNRAMVDLTRAAELDPGMAIAWVRITLVRAMDWASDATAMRAGYAKAFSLRGELDDRGVALLDILEAEMRDVPDWADALKRAQRAVDRWPMDAELSSIVGYLHWMNGDIVAAHASLKRAVEIDPTYADAWQALGRAKGKLGDSDGALQALGRCLDISPTSIDCLRDRSSLEDERGRCEQVQIDAKRAELLDLRAAAMIANGAPREGVEEVLAMKPVFPPLHTPRELRANLAVLDGDFARAETLVREWLASTASDANIEVHARPTRLLAEILVETNRVAEADAVARDYLLRTDTWLGAPTQATLVLLGIRRVHGDLSEEAWKTQVDRETRYRVGRHDGERWALAWGTVARTKETADAALVEFAKLGDKPFEDLSLDIWEGLAGRVFFMAGKTSDALPLLRRATARCTGLFYPFAQMRAHYWLGEALESIGDRSAACGHYRIVIDHWGKTKSTTAELARKKSCPH